MMTTAQSETTTIELPLSAYPGIRSFPLDLVSGSARAAAFSSRRSFEEITPRPPSRDRSALASALASSNRAWGNDVTPEIDRWARGESVALIGGQQVGFAGGPLLTLTKIASLLKLKRTLEASGVMATVFFWMATEDHDFGEIACLDWPDRDGSIQQLRCPHPESLTRSVGSLPVPDVLRRQFLQISGIDEPEWLREGISFRDSFARLVAEAVGGRGVVLVDSLEPELRRAGAPLLRSLVERMDEAEAAVRGRSAEIARAGYDPQVVPNQDDHFSVLYLVAADGERVPLRRVQDGWMLGEAVIPASEVMRRIDKAPETISTGALARPLLQDFVFEPAVFVGGPAEVAYYGQVLPLHAMFGIEAPHVALRGHVLAAPEKVLRAIDRYEITPVELTLSPDEILAKREWRAIEELEREIEMLGAAVDAKVSPIRRMIVEADSGMRSSTDRTLRRISHHVAKLGQRGARAIARRDAERHRAVTRLCGTLFPGGVPQDRRSAWIGLWLQYRAALVERLVEQIEPDATTFRITGV